MGSLKFFLVPVINKPIFATYMGGLGYFAVDERQNEPNHCSRQMQRRAGGLDISCPDSVREARGQGPSIHSMNLGGINVVI